MNIPARGAMVSPPSHRASDDDVAELRGSLDHAIQAIENLRAYLNIADRQAERDLEGYTGIGRVRDGMNLDKALADLTRILDTVRR